MSEKKPRSDKFEAGLKTRKAVLGDAYVDASISCSRRFYVAPTGTSDRVLLGQYLEP